jgi:hypothetical protein
MPQPFNRLGAGSFRQSWKIFSRLSPMKRRPSNGA